MRARHDEKAGGGQLNPPPDTVRQEHMGLRRATEPRHMRSALTGRAIHYDEKRYDIGAVFVEITALTRARGGR